MPLVPTMLYKIKKRSAASASTVVHDPKFSLLTYQHTFLLENKYIFISAMGTCCRYWGNMIINNYHSCGA